MFLFAATLQVVGAPSTFTRNVPSGPPACGQLSSIVMGGVDASVPLPSGAGLEASSAPTPELVPEPTTLPELPEPTTTLPEELMPEPPAIMPEDSPEPALEAPLDPLLASACPPGGGCVLDSEPQPVAASSAHTSSPGRKVVV